MYYYKPVESLLDLKKNKVYTKNGEEYLVLSKTKDEVVCSVNNSRTEVIAFTQTNCETYLDNVLADNKEHIFYKLGGK